MLVGTKEVSLSFFLFCCSASSLALASSVEMMFFIFALEAKKILIVRKGSRLRSARCMDLENTNSTAVASDAVFERGGSAIETDTLSQRQNGSSYLEAGPIFSAGHKEVLQKAARLRSQKSLFPEVTGWSCTKPWGWCNQPQDQSDQSRTRLNPIPSQTGNVASRHSAALPAKSCSSWQSWPAPTDL